jgi:ABC-type transport system substrate-binding protein
MIKNLFRGRAFVPGPPGVYPVSADIDIPYWMDYAAKIFRYDPDGAIQLLKDAGYPNGFSIKLWYIQGPGYDFMPDVAQVVQGYWAKIGVKAEITPVDITVRKIQGDTLSHPDSSWVGTAYTHIMSVNAVVPERINAVFGSGTAFNFLGKAFPQVDTMIKSASSEMDPAKRKETLNTLIPLVTETYTALNIAYVPALVASGSKVDFTLPPPPLVAPFGYYLDTTKHK